MTKNTKDPKVLGSNSHEVRMRTGQSPTETAPSSVAPTGLTPAIAVGDVEMSVPAEQEARYTNVSRGSKRAKHAAARDAGVALAGHTSGLRLGASTSSGRTFADVAADPLGVKPQTPVKASWADEVEEDERRASGAGATTSSRAASTGNCIGELLAVLNKYSNNVSTDALRAVMAIKGVVPKTPIPFSAAFAERSTSSGTFRPPTGSKKSKPRPVSGRASPSKAAWNKAVAELNKLIATKARGTSVGRLLPDDPLLTRRDDLFKKKPPSS